MNDCQKWAFLRSVPHTDKWNGDILKIAKHLYAAASCCDGLHTWERRYAMLAHTVARDWIHQVSDTIRTGGEDIAGLTREPRADDAVDALKRGTDDCDAKARLFVALCLAAGVTARVVPYWHVPGGATVHDYWQCPEGGQLYHVAAEVWLDKTWQPVELTLSRARLGERGEVVPVEQAGVLRGKWRDA